jgi:hypothetical protein
MIITRIVISIKKIATMWLEKISKRISNMNLMKKSSFQVENNNNRI